MCDCNKEKNGTIEKILAAILSLIETIKGVFDKKTSKLPAVVFVRDLEGNPYCIVRTHEPGVFAAYIKSNINGTIELLHARRIWYWEGTATLSELATEGTTKPNSCKFPMAVPYVLLDNIGEVEITPITERAKKSIDSVPVWRQSSPN